MIEPKKKQQQQTVSALFMHSIKKVTEFLPSVDSFDNCLHRGCFSIHIFSSEEEKNVKFILRNEQILN